MRIDENSKSVIVHFTDKMISDFSLMTEDENMLHTSNLFARESGYEGGRIVNGAFIISISNSLVANYVGHGCLILSQEAKFLSPCHSGYRCRFCIESIHDHLGGNYSEYKVVVNSTDSKEIIFSKIKYLVKIP